MAPRTTRRSKKQATIGIFGLGEANAKNLTPLLDDFLDGLEATFIVPITKDHTTDSVQAVLDYAADKDIPFHAVIDDSVAKSRTLKALLKDADGETKATDVGVEIVNLLKDAEDGRLVMLWDEELGDGEDGGAYDAVEYADEHDIPAYNLCKAMQVIDFGDDGSGESAAEETDDGEDEEEPPAKEAPKARRGRAAKAAAVEDDDDPEEEPVASGDDPRADLPPYKEAVKLGIRQLRTLARERELASNRAIGSMDKDGVLDLLYPDGDVPAAPTASPTTFEQLTLEEQVGAAQHQIVNGNGGMISMAMFVEMISVSVAERVKELVDA